jgi:hypothetical protein
MCDRCGVVFSERSEGWTTFTGTTRKKHAQTGEFVTVSDTMDSCPECSELMMNGGRRPELTSTVRPEYRAPGIEGDDHH